MGDVLAEDLAIAETIALLNHYGFELDGYAAPVVITQWQAQHPVDWLRPAVLEALYRGRYKKVSVEEILRVWEKWGEPKCNFNSEFEALICAKLTAEAPILPLEPIQEVIVPTLELSLETLVPDPEIARGQGIERFQPQPDLDSSDAYQKLKAIAAQPHPLETDPPENKKP